VFNLPLLVGCDSFWPEWNSFQQQQHEKWLFSFSSKRTSAAVWGEKQNCNYHVAFLLRNKQASRQARATSEGVKLMDAVTSNAFFMCVRKKTALNLSADERSPLTFIPVTWWHLLCCCDSPRQAAPAAAAAKEWWMNVNVIKQFSVYLKLQTFTPARSVIPGKQQQPASQQQQHHPHFLSWACQRQCQENFLSSFFLSFCFAFLLVALPNFLLLLLRKKVYFMFMGFYVACLYLSLLCCLRFQRRTSSQWLSLSDKQQASKQQKEMIS